jgi:heptosyltransferase-2
MKILVLALSGIGDALMFTPSIKLMKDKLPDAQIDALVMYGGVKDIYERLPYLNKVIFFDFLKEGVFASLKFVLSLRKKYDVSINVYPSNRKEYNIINFLVGARQRAGIKYLRKDFQNLGWLNNIRLLENDSLHNVQENINLCAKLFRTNFGDDPELEFPLTQSDLEFARMLIEKLQINEDEVVIGFHPGSAVLKNHINRRWEPEKFAELASMLIEQKNARILIFGGPDERELKDRIKRLINNVSADSIETEDLAQTAAVMKRCNVFVSNDSSLMHVASALKLKVIAVIGPTNPNYIHPWKTVHKIIRLDLDCSPCFYYSPRPLTCIRSDVKYKCIKELSVEMVLQAVEELLAKVN